MLTGWMDALMNDMPQMKQTYAESINKMKEIYEEVMKEVRVFRQKVDHSSNKTAKETDAAQLLEKRCNDIYNKHKNNITFDGKLLMA